MKHRVDKFSLACAGVLILLTACTPARGAAPTTDLVSPETTVVSTQSTVPASVPGETGPPPSQATSTTATSPSSTEQGAPATTVDGGAGFVAHIGCSQTKLAIRGYQELGGTRLERYETGGGQINLWSKNAGPYWDEFDAAVAGKVITAGWMEICITGGNEDNTKYEDVLAALAVFRSKVPEGTPIYVSGLEIFEPVDSCRIAGPTVPPLTREYADQLAAEGLAERGPDLGPLTPALTTDGCHPNGAGQQLLGEQLIAFFGP